MRTHVCYNDDGTYETRQKIDDEIRAAVFGAPDAESGLWPSGYSEDVQGPAYEDQDGVQVMTEPAKRRLIFDHGIVSEDKIKELQAAGYEVYHK